MTDPAFAQRGGGGHGGGGFHGGGGGFHSGGAFHGGSQFSRGGMRGGFSRRSFSGEGMRSPMGRSILRFNNRFNWGRTSGSSHFNSRSFGRGGRAPSRHPGWTRFEGSATRNAGAGTGHTNRAIADGQWHSFAGRSRTSDPPGAARESGDAGAHTPAELPHHMAGAAEAASATQFNAGERTSSVSPSNSTRSSSISTGRPISNLQTSRINSGMRSASMRTSAVSGAGNSASVRGVSNASPASARLSRDTMARRSSFFTRSTTHDPFRAAGLNRDFHGGFFNDHDFDDFGFRRGFFDRDFDFDDFGFRCFGCGFGFGFGPAFGFGFGWGWGGWWDPWWWDPWWRLRLWGSVPTPVPHFVA